MWLDISGVVLLGALIGWTYRAAHVSGGDAAPAVAVAGLSALAFVAGRVLGRFSRWLVPAALVGSAIAVALTSHGLLSHGSAPPFGYTNANGAFFTVAAFAAAMIGAADRRLRVPGFALAVSFALVPLMNGSVGAAVASLLILVAIGAVLLGERGPRIVVAACAVLLLAALGATMALGASYRAGPRSSAIDRLVDRTLTERRVALWHDALVIIGAHPVDGVGPGRFDRVSPTALHDPDARWAHNEFLEQGAETGVLGLILTLSLFLWVLARVWATRPGIYALLGAAAVAALGINATVDYVLHFPAIPVAAAALAGSAVGARRAHEGAGP